MRALGSCVRDHDDGYERLKESCHKISLRSQTGQISGITPKCSGILLKILAQHLDTILAKACSIHFEDRFARIWIFRISNFCRILWLVHGLKLFGIQNTLINSDAQSGDSYSPIDMKFGKQIQQAIASSNPEWGPFWVNYKGLKKQIKEVVRTSSTSTNRVQDLGKRLSFFPMQYRNYWSIK